MTDLLATGSVTLLARHPAASNAVFVTVVGGTAGTTRAIYKPIAGERPLWDFPEGRLARREVAAFRFAEALGIRAVPETVWRDDLPHGPGSLQRWIDEASTQDVEILREPVAGWLPVLDAELEDGTPVTVAHRDRAELRSLAVFDALINNGDRKAGHLLRDGSGTLWAVDHGVSFHVEPKLRTVLWGFSGQLLDDAELHVVSSVAGAAEALRDWLDGAEIEALLLRAERMARDGVFPTPSGDWPAIPWPLY